MISSGIGLVHIALGEREEAFEWLDGAVRERGVPALWYQVDPRLDPLRSDPRFKNLVRRAGLPAD